MGFMAPWGDFMMANYLIHQNSQGMNVAVGMFEWLSRTNVNTHYTRDAWVDSIENNVVTFIDSCGYTWEADEVDNIVEGQTVVLKMHTNHTDSIVSDDVIVSIKPVAITLQ
jgi:hypothetical protein